MVTIIKLQKDYHFISVENPNSQSAASYILLKNSYRLKEKKEGRTAVPEWRRWLTFRNKYMRRQLKLSSGNLVCSYCFTNYLDPNMNNPYRKRFREVATVDHIKALAKGGLKYDEENMCVCCNKCNNKKKDMDLEVFKK